MDYKELRWLYINEVRTQLGVVVAIGFGIANDISSRFEQHRSSLKKHNQGYTLHLIGAYLGYNDDIVQVEASMKYDKLVPIKNLNTDGFRTETVDPKYRADIFNHVNKFMSDKDSDIIDNKYELNMLTISGIRKPAPILVVKDIISNIDIIPESILIIGNDGYGGFSMMKEAKAKYRFANITFVISDDSAYDDAKHQYGDSTMVTLIHSDFLTHDFKDQRFDLVLMNPPFTKFGPKFMDKAITLSNTVGYILSINKQIEKYIKRTNVIKVVNTQKSMDYMGVNACVAVGIYNKGFSNPNNIRGLLLEGINRKTYAGRETFGTANGTKALNNKSLKGFVVSFARHSDKYGSGYIYVDDDTTLQDLIDAGHARFSGIKCSKSEAQEAYDLARQCSLLNTGKRTVGTLTYDSGYFNGFILLGLN